MRIKVVSRKGVSLKEIEISAAATVKDLKLEFQAAKGLNIHRQYFTTADTDAKNRIALKEESKSLASYGVKDGDSLMIKDLGPQVSWRTVFLVEYFGPLIIHSIIFHLPFLFYPGIPPRPKSLVQTLAFYMVVIHYAKREFESVFIHRFSSATMPLRNIFKNSFHYWFLGGAFIAYFIYHPRFTSFVSDEVAVVLFILMLLCMLGNLITHIILMNLRPAGTTKRAIPKGFLFNYVSCPNYFLEITEWVLFALMTQSISSAIFAIVSAGQMWIWAVQKHRRYKKEFSGKDDTEKYPPRKILIPFLL